MSINEMPKKRVTLKMIAQEAGTSIGTVDRALNNRGGISQESKDHVLKVSRRLGYTPNKFASALGRKRTLTIGMAYPVRPTEFYQYIDHGIDLAAKELQDYNVVIEKIRYLDQNPDTLYKALEKVDLNKFDGLAINSSGRSTTEQINRLIKHGMPVVTFNTDAPESQRLFYVGIDSWLSGMLAAELLSLLMCSKGEIAVLGNYANVTPFVERLGGFCEYLHRNAPQIQFYPFSNLYSQIDNTTEYLVQKFNANPGITGIFCTGYYTTSCAIDALKYLDRKDIHLCGFDVTPKTSQALKDGWCSALLHQEPSAQGYQAAMLLAKHLMDGWMPETAKLHTKTQIVLKSNLDSYTETDFLLKDDVLLRS